MKLSRSSMLYGTLLLTGTSLVAQVLGFIYRIFLSRLVGAEIMGLYQLLLPVSSVVLSLTAVGLTAAVSNLSAEYAARGNEGAMGAVLRRCLFLFLQMCIRDSLAAFFTSRTCTWMSSCARLTAGFSTTTASALAWSKGAFFITPGRTVDI